MSTFAVININPFLYLATFLASKIQVSHLLDDELPKFLLKISFYIYCNELISVKPQKGGGGGVGWV